MIRAGASTAPVLRALRALASTSGSAKSLATSNRSGRPEPLARIQRRCESTLTLPSTHSHHASTEISPTSHLIPQATVTEDKLIIDWPDGRSSKFDHFYLFDHCRCSRCFHTKTKQRLKPLSEIPIITPQWVTTDRHGLHVKWSTITPHESYFPFSFLKRAAYDPPSSEAQVTSERILWNSKIGNSPPSVSYESIISPDVSEEVRERGVMRWLNNVHDFGFCFVTGVPPTPEDTKQLIERIGKIRETHYGGFWDFTADMSHGDLAYSDEALPAHTDTTYFTDPAGLQIFHLLSHPSPPGTGGASLLVDGFYSASLLSTLHPTSYSLLSRLRVPFHASGTAGTFLRPVINQPVLRHDGHGNLVQVRWNNEDRGILGAGWRPDEVRGWYEAAKKFEALGRSEDAEYWVQLAPGTVVVIDNWRVMHGRSAFTGERRMCGAYVGADDWRSRRTALRKRFHAKRSAETDDLWDIGW